MAYKELRCVNGILTPPPISPTPSDNSTENKRVVDSDLQRQKAEAEGKSVDNKPIQSIIRMR